MTFSTRYFLLILAMVIAAGSAPQPVYAAGTALPIAQNPLFLKSPQPPLMMMVLSRDEQLFNKAYTDYTDLVGNGTIAATYLNTFTYSGYFGPDLCYSYNAGVYKANAAATNHACTNAWSGNFLNWVTMSRLDVLRSVLYGGLRSTDTATQTILERAAIPNDLHAWVKVYSGADISSYTPFTGTVSFCNATFADSTNPIMRVAQGNWTEWSATQDSQCNWHDTQNDANNAALAVGLGSKNYTVRVDVCDETGATPREPICSPYPLGASSPTNYKPDGLLQQYGNDGRVRFGLMTGTNADPRSGGRLRRNISLFAGNGTNPAACVDGDEVMLSNGTFCNQTAGYEGIVNTLNRFALIGWLGNVNGNSSGWKGGEGGVYNDSCYAWGGRARSGNAGAWVLDNPGNGDRHCSAWGNPLSEIYAEALRYIEGRSNSASPQFDDLSNDTIYLPGVPDHLGWIDPYGNANTNASHGKGGGNKYCASCNILVLSTGLNTFDSDEIPADSAGLNAKTATDEVGDDEGISGGNYLIGRVLGLGGSPATLALGASISTSGDLCTAKTVDKLSNAIGICPDVPSQEGSYNIAGLAFKAWTKDLRSDLLSRAVGYINRAQTFTVALAENLPSFTIPVSGKTVTISPICQSNTNGAALITDANWSSCALGAVLVGSKQAQIAPNYIYGRPLLADGTAGSYSFTWEDSTFGSDHDLDSTNVFTWCVSGACTYTNGQAKLNIDGTAYTGYDICWRSDSAICTGSGGRPIVAAGQVLMRVETTSTAGGYAMLEGFNVAGTATDGAQRLALAAGSFISILTGQANPPVAWYLPKVVSFTAGATSVKRLQNPLWYAAKYGGFSDANNNGKPDSTEWDSKVAGTPDNFFLARDPSKLRAALTAVFDKVAAQGQGSGSQADTGVRLSTGTASQTFATSFAVDSSGFDWTGDLVASGINTTGGTSSQLWSARARLAAQIGSGSRTIVIANKATDTTGATGQFLTSSALGGSATAQLDKIGLKVGFYPPWLGTTPTSTQVDDIVAYLSGSPAKEVKNTGTMRNRSWALGDMINSSPVVSSPKDDFGYINAPTTGGGGAPYTTYVTTTKAGRPTVAYVGANDGMLHAFNAKPCTFTGTPPVVVLPCPPSGAGDEMFAFIPNSVVGNLGQLPNPSYSHQYYMDGQINVADAFYGAAWHTVLVGAPGAGGKGVFGLLVDNPSTFTGGNVLWEINGSSDSTHGGNDIGYVYSTPQVILGEDDQWYAVFGNGYNSVNGKAVLFIVNIATGAVKTITATDASDAATTSNGIGQIAAIDVNGDGRTDTVYGGDYHGRLWKFDLGIANVTGVSPPSSWGVAFSGAPLFVAKDSLGNPQPITSGFEVAPGPLGGAMVYFGTGSYMLTSDNTPLPTPFVHSLYAIWDPDASIAPAIATAVAGRASLQAQTITSQQKVGIYTTRSTSSNGVTYTLAAGTQRGWYMDLINPGQLAYVDSAGLPVPAIPALPDGEMFFGTPRIQNGIVFFTAFEPKSDGCVPGGTRWEYGLSALTGANALGQVRVGDLGGASVCPSGGCGGLSIGEGSPVRNTSIVIPAPPCIPGFGTSCPILPKVCNVLTGICTPPTPPTDPSLYSACSIVVRTTNDPTAPPLALPRPCGRQSWRQVR